ncbi:MAG: indole-3-glycerol-phosphate synthase [Parachlamydiaceae bacterium]|nr:indole-3-glycerol-phosphate synthase [Parachlamydiaceae bacterium]
MKPADYLNKIISNKKIEIDKLIQETKSNRNHSLNMILNQTYTTSKRFSSALKGGKLSVIGEVKRRSPSLGEISKIEDPVKLALQYCDGGASAISILTDTKHFGGSLSDLSLVKRELAIPYPNIAVLRKDFIIHPLQLAEAVLAGADAILLIANVVRQDLKVLIQEATRLGLEVLTEIHDLADLDLALDAEAPIIGINHRNLETFNIDIGISEKLRPLIPPHIITVAESGIHHPNQAKIMRDLGYDAILVGEALVNSTDASKLIKEMKGEYNES